MPSAILTHEVFNWCVQFLTWLGNLLGMSYQAINVWIFCILWPAFTLLLIVIVLHQRRKIRALTRRP